MFGKKKKAQEPVVEPKPEEKPTPAYLRPDYPYPAVGDPITNMDELEDTGVVYEIKCHECEMSIRSQGKNIKDTYKRLMEGNGCIGCGNKDLVVRRVDMSKAEEKLKAEAAAKVAEAAAGASTNTADGAEATAE